MLIGDMLNIVGMLKLKEFEWGSALVDLFNEKLAEHVVNESRLLTAEHTGFEARAALYNLPATELAALVVLDFDPGSRTVNDDVPLAAVGDHVPPSPPTPDPNAVEIVEARKSRTVLFISALLVAIALMLVSYSTTTATSDEQKPDQSTVDTVVQVIQDLFESFLTIHPGYE